MMPTSINRADRERLAISSSIWIEEAERLAAYFAESQVSLRGWQGSTGFVWQHTSLFIPYFAST